MKSALFIFLFSLFSCVTFAQFKKNDTTFLVREVKDSIDYGYDYYHAIYFERNKNAQEYKWIADFGFSKFDGKKEYQRNINHLKKTLKTKLKKTQLKDIITRWCMLYSYKDSFYMYSPSEYCWNYQFQITDSVVIDKGCERMLSVLDTIIKKSETHYQLKLKSPRYSLQHLEKFIRTINIYIIDKKEGIAVFEDDYGANVFEDDYTGRKEYRLMINAANIKHFPLIVNYCKTDKQFEEFKFDKIDFDSLLKKFRTHKSAMQQKLNKNSNARNKNSSSKFGIDISKSNKLIMPSA